MEKGSKGILISQSVILFLILMSLFLRWTNIPDERSKFLHIKNGKSLEYGPYEKIDINNADIDKIKMIPGIGDILAERIIMFRKANGAFSDLKDIEKVNGIGKKKIEVIKNFVIFR